MKLDKLDLQAKRAKLDEIRAQLKREFFGIDRQIDDIIYSIQTWYLMPQIVTRPVIISLWSLTGHGKTSVVRSLVNKLGFDTKFVEIQMDSSSISADTGRPNSVCGVLQSSSINEQEAGVVFLDEFQRFRTVEKGEDVKVERYHDVWMLLSDGKFSNDHSFLSKLESQLALADYDEDQRKAWKAEEEAARERRAKKDRKPDAATDDDDDEQVTVKYTRKYTLYPTEAKTTKKLLRLVEPIQEIMTWDSAKVRGLLRRYVEENRNNSIDFTRCLVFVAGNLDEAYRMSGNVEDCDTNADIFHEWTKKIGVIEIKAALATRFKPEQIARLGNNHVIYPSLSSHAYRQLIERTCRQYVEEAERAAGVAFTIEPTVYREIYENSVYPAQGTRPVFTSIHKMLGSPLSDAVLWALEREILAVAISLSIPDSSLVFTAGEATLKVHIDFDIRSRKKAQSADFNALVAVHEAGHAIVYAALFHQPPREIAINVASFKGGYNLYESASLSKQQILDHAAVSMGGIAAERRVFGDEMRSSGCSADVQKATIGVSNFVRRLAMHDYSSCIGRSNDGSLYDNVEVADDRIEALVAAARRRAEQILDTHALLLTDLSRHLMKDNKLDDRQFLTFVGDRLPGLRPLADKDVVGDYAARLGVA